MTLTSSAASLVPISTPAAAATLATSTVSASGGPVSCQRVAPRALSRADSSSRLPASSRAARASAAAASSASCSAPMASSDLATARLLARPVSSWGRPVVTCAPFRLFPVCSCAAAWLTFPARLSRSSGRMPSGSSRATQDTLPTVRRPGPNAAGLATAGP